MGLQERRRIKELADVVLPEVSKRFHDETGLDVSIEIDVESFSKIADVEQLNGTLDWVSGHVNSGEFWNDPIRAWKSFVADELGRSAVKEKVRAWRVVHDPSQPTGLSLNEGAIVHHLNAGDGWGVRMFEDNFGRQLSAALSGGGLPLEQRRNVRQIQLEVVPQYRAELERVTGHKIDLEVVDNFAEMKDDAARQGSLDWLRGWVNSGELWTELVAAFQQIAADDLGKQAIKDSIQKIVVRWEKGKGADVRLEKGVLTYLYNFVDCPSDGSSRLFTAAIREKLENQL
jgi:hypothetical protein